MASTIAAITTGIGGIVTTADATGNLSLLSGTSTVVAVTSAGAAVTGTMSVSGATTLTGGLNTPLAVTSGGTGVATSTGSGANALATSPTLVTPILGTPTSGVATNLTGLPLTTGVTGTLPVANGGTGVATSTGTGAVVLGTSPTLTTPVINGFTGDTSVINIGSGQVYKDASGNVGIGTATPAGRLDVTGANVVVRSTASSGYASFYASGATGQGAYNFFAINGTETARIYSDANNYIAFATGASATERMRIDSSGNVLVKSPAGLGYGTGSGGTVTQATSKSTSVTLNKPTGQITMNNAALLPATSVVFILNNSIITAIDSVILSGASSLANSYRIEMSYLQTGSAVIRITNISAGSLSEAVAINFAIIKGATS